MRVETASSGRLAGVRAPRTPSTGRRVPVASAAVLVSLLLPSCGGQGMLPAAPSDVTAGLTLYEHANYEGGSALLTQSIGDLTDFKGPCEHEVDGYDGTSTTFYDWNDCISSIRLAPGWRATVYRDTDYEGDSVVVTGNLSNLQLVAGRCAHDGMNDCISSIRLTPP